MDKLEVQKRVLQDGKQLDLEKFEWDKKTKTFSSEESYLIIDFTGIAGCTFYTGHGCAFYTGHGCTFYIGYGCTFYTGYGCTFKTGHCCTFKTGHCCTFNTSDGCTFYTGYGCTFKTGHDCTWVIQKKAYKFPPLHFCGSQYFMEFSKPGFIRSGCIEKPLAWWEENIVRCAEEHDYTPEQIEEYKLYVQMLKLWMVANKLDKEKNDE